MKRISLFATLVVTAAVAMAAMASVSMASAGDHTAAAKSAVKAEKTPFSEEYDATEYYGSVKCTGVHIVNKKYSGGKDVETCDSTTDTLEHVKAGKGQTAFENNTGGTVSEWSSDYNGVTTSDFTYSVNKKLTQFKIVAIYPAPTTEE